MSPRRAARFAASIAVVGLVAASCGTGSDSSAPAPTDPAPPVTAADTAPDPAMTDSVEAAPEPETPATEAPASEAPATEAPATETPATDAPAPEPAPVPEILQFTAPLVGGGEIDAAALAGKATVFWFWAPT